MLADKADVSDTISVIAAVALDVWPLTTTNEELPKKFPAMSTTLKLDVLASIATALAMLLTKLGALLLSYRSPLACLPKKSILSTTNVPLFSDADWE